MSARKPDVKQAERFMNRAFGTGIREHQINQNSPFPRAYISDAARVIRNSGVGELLERWRVEDGTEPRGRKAHISMESALIIMLMHALAGQGLLLSAMSDTLANRLSPAALELIGIAPRPGEQTDWYNRLWRCVARLISLIDAFPGPQGALLKDGAYRRVLESRDPIAVAKKLARVRKVKNLLVGGSVEVLPKAIFDRWRGNIAIDATLTPMWGRAGNPGSDLIDADRRSCNYDAGYYKRDGNHDGESDGASGRGKLIWGLEMGSATMTANVPGEQADFPLLTLAIDGHRPGAIKEEGRRLLEAITSRGYPAGHFMADRAYLPGARAEDLQGPLIRAGYTPVFDYGLDDIGIKESYEHAVMVTGQWYVNALTPDLVNAEKLHAIATQRIRHDNHVLRAKTARALKGRKASATVLDVSDDDEPDANEQITQRKRDADAQFDQRLKLRELYRLKPKGQRRPDGSQQYMYPDPRTYVRVDTVTGEVLPPLTKRTLVIPLEVGLKYGQKYVFKGAKWRGLYALRNTVESSYSYMKNSATEDLANPQKRQKRGNTFAFLAMAISVASANLRRIATYITELGSAGPVNSKNKKSFIPADELDLPHPTNLGPPPLE